MKQATIRWILYLAAALVVGPLAALPIAGLRGADGGPDATPLVCSSPMAGVVAAAVALAAAAAMGALAARLCGRSTGMSAAGVVLAWSAWRTAEIDGLIRWEQSPFIRLAIEGLVMGLAGVGIAALISAVGARDAADAPPGAAGGGPKPGSNTGSKPGPKADSRLGSTGAALAAAVVVAGAAVWLIAVSMLRGQVIAAAITAGLGAALAGRALSPSMPMAMILAVAGFFAVAAPVVAAVQVPADSYPVAASNGLWPWFRLLPMDWVAGAFLGAPLGAAWAASMSSRHHAE